MRDRWEQIEQNAREFWLDVHAVTSNFFGEKDWKWLIQNDNQHQAGDDAQPATGLWERFKKEIMTNARFYSEDSAFEDRMILGVGAAAYAIPYGLGRLFYDGTLNLVEYATWRVTDHAYTPSHPEGRKKNGHALGAPLAAPFVALAVTIEAIARVAGISAYGGHIIQAAGKRSANLSKYTRGIFGKYSAESIQKNVDGLSARPQSAWDIADRCAYVTLPGVIAFAEILGAVALTSTFGLGEGVGRSLGVSRRGAASITLASKVSANIMSRYVGKCTGTYDAVSLKKDCGIIFGKINNGWEALDALGAFTLPLAIGLVETSAALALTGTFGGTEILGRVIGISAYGGHIIQAAGKRAANLSKYTRGIFGKYSAESIQKNVDGLSARPQSAWDIADRCAYVTLPGVIAFAEILGAVALTSTFGLGEGVGRSLGVSRRGAASITLASKVSANIMSRYVGKCTGTYDAVSLKKDCGIIFGKINNGWEALDALGAFTLPLTIGLVEASAALALTGTLGLGESLGRLAGISDRSKNGVLATLATMGHFLGFSHSTEHYTRAFTKPVRSWWDACDVVGTVMSGVTIGLLATVISTPLALIGMSKSNYHRFNYYRHRIKNAINERRDVAVDRALEEYHAAELEKCESSFSGAFFSKFNILNIIGQTVYAFSRYILAPFAYTLGIAFKNFGGIIPLVKWMAAPIPDNETVEGSVRQRFADLKKSLNEYGHLQMENVEHGLKIANDRTLMGKIKFGLFSEGRKIMSLGHTPEEKVLSEFSSKFEEYVRATKRQKQSVSTHAFFKDDIAWNKKRFDYDTMVAHIQQSFGSQVDKRAVANIAELIKNDIISAGDQNTRRLEN